MGSEGDAFKGVLQGHQSDVRALDFTENSRSLKSVGGDGFGHWDVPSLSLKKFNKQNLGKTIMVAINADADRAVFSYGRQKAHAELWSLSSGKKLTSLVGHSDAIYGLGIDPKAKWTITGSWDGNVIKWDARSGRQMSRIRQGARVNGAAVHPSGRLIATADADQMVRLYHWESKTPTVLKGHVAEVNTVAFARDGEALVSGGDDGTLRPWRVRDGRPMWSAPALLGKPSRLLTHEGWFHLATSNSQPILVPQKWARYAQSESRKAANSAGQPWLCIETYDEHLELWNMDEDARKWRVSIKPSSQIIATKEGCIVAGDTRLEMYPVSGPKRSLTIGKKLKYVEEYRGDLLFVSDSHINRQKTDGRAPQTIPVEPGVSVATFIELPNRQGTHALLGYRDGSLELRTVRGDRLGSTFLKDHSSHAAVTRVVSDDRGYAAIGYGNGTIGLWDLTTGRWLGSGTLHGSVTHLAMDENRLYGATDLGRSLRWDLSTFRLDRCQLLRQVWSQVPYIWSDGKAVLAQAPKRHSCQSSDKTLGTKTN